MSLREVIFACLKQDVPMSRKEIREKVGKSHSHSTIHTCLIELRDQGRAKTVDVRPPRCCHTRYIDRWRAPKVGWLKCEG